MALLVPDRAPGADGRARAEGGAPGDGPRGGPGAGWSLPGSPRPAALLAVVGLLGALVVALVAGGGAPQPSTAGLPTAGPVTGWGLPVATLLVRLASVAAVGGLVLAALLVPRDLPDGDVLRRRALRLAGAAAGVWLAAEALRVVLLTSSLLGVPATAVPPRAVLDVLVGLAPGRAALVTAVLLLLVVVGSRLRTDRPGPARFPSARFPSARWHSPVLLVLALAALLSPVVLAGHSAGSGDHALAVTSLAVHVVTAATWVGGLGAVLLLARTSPRPGPVVRRFSALALGCVVLLGVSGVVSAAVLTGARSPAALAALLGSGYGALLLVKTGALALLVAAGALHRRRTVTALEAGRPRAFARLAAAEVVLMGLTIAVAVALAASPPPVADGSPAALASAAAPDPGDAAGDPGAAGAEPGAEPGPGSGPEVGPESGPESGSEPGSEIDPGSGASGAVDGAVPVDGPGPGEVVDPMAGHDHGELSVGVLVDDSRFHVARAVSPGQPVTVYNSSDTTVTITAADGGFDVEVPGRTFMTFPAPRAPGSYPFASRTDPAFADTLVVAAG